MGCHARSRSTAKRAAGVVLGVERAESDAYVTACPSSALGPAVEHMHMSHRRACRPYVDGALWVVARAAGQRPNARLGWYWELREPDQMHTRLPDWLIVPSTSDEVQLGEGGKRRFSAPFLLVEAALF